MTYAYFDKYKETTEANIEIINPENLKKIIKAMAKTCYDDKIKKVDATKAAR